MKSTFRVLMVLVLSCGILLPTSMARAKETRIEFTGLEICTGETLVIPVEWYPGRNWQARGATETCTDTADTPMMTGLDYVYDMKAICNQNTCILSGKVRMETDEGGTWVGSWVSPAYAPWIKIVAHGEGIYEGMHLYWIIYFLEDSTPFYGIISYNEK